LRSIDCHIHILPRDLLNPKLLGSDRNWGTIKKALDPEFLIETLEEANVEKAFIISTVSQVGGFPFRVNDFIADYCAKYPDRLTPIGSLDPRQTENAEKDLHHLVSNLAVRGIKIHPCHQHFYANEYKTNGLHSLETIYSVAQERKLPVMIHTGTSVFPNARNIFGDPIYVDDVALDFPDLNIILAHGGRPLWTEKAFFLVRRHKNVYMDISGIPPKRLLDYFPRLEQVAEKTMFGSDWPDPSVKSIKENIDSFASLPISAAAQRQILRETTLKIMSN
jgi:uncharacterized protein